MPMSARRTDRRSPSDPRVPQVDRVGFGTRVELRVVGRARSGEQLDQWSRSQPACRMVIELANPWLAHGVGEVRAAVLQSLALSVCCAVECERDFGHANGRLE